MDRIPHETPGGNGSHTRPGIANGRRPLPLPTDAELDGLADLFLGPRADGRPAARPAEVGSSNSARPSPALEGLVLGHLPVFAAAWPAQYARQRAEESGHPVAIVRLASGTLTVELIGCGDASGAALDDWERALGCAVASAPLLLLRVDEPAEAELASLGGLTALRLLTGADDAAVVACYRKLKGLAASAELAGGALPRLGLAVLGATPERGVDAHGRIVRAARAFLEADLEAPVVVERIAPTGSTLLYRGSPAITLADLAFALGRAMAPEARAARAPEAPEGPSPGAERRPASEPRAAGAPEHSAGSPPGESPIGLVGGLTPLETRCPHADRVELGADAAGRLHLVAALLEEHPALSSRRSLRDLLRAAAWARENARLLAKAEPSLSDMRGEPLLHLVTDRADAARALLSTPVRVHLAVRARAAALGMVAVSLEG